MSAARRILLISGAPGAGKTSLALPLASHLGWPLISKDVIKETLFDAMGGTPDSLEDSRRFGAGAMETMWALAAHCPEVILEANFRPHSAYERNRLIALGGRVVEIYCACPLPIAQARIVARGEAGIHPAHPWRLLPPDALVEYDGPIGVGELIAVDTTQPVAIEEIAERARAAFAP